MIASNLAAMLSAANVAREREEARVTASGSLTDEQIKVVGQEHNTAVLRRWLLSVPARLMRSARRWYPRLARGMSHKQEFWALHRYLAALGASG